MQRLIPPTFMTMEVPCCSGLLVLAKKAAEKASRKIPVKSITIGIKGDILKEEWILEENIWKDVFNQEIKHLILF